MGLFHQFTLILESYAQKVPVEVFSLLGTFIEEVIAPIPSPFVMATAGSIAAIQSKPFVFLVWLSFIGAIGKLFGALILYFVADKAEDLVVVKFGKFLGVNHNDVEKIGQILSKPRGTFFLFLIRATPVIPSAPISAIAGILKVEIKTYLLATFFGTLIKNIIYSLVGYSGLETYRMVLNGVDQIETLIEIVIAFVFLAILGVLYYRRSKTNPLGWFSKLGNKEK